MSFPTLLELRLVQETLFKNVLEAISDLFSEAKFDFSGTGIKLQAIDTSQAALVALLLPAEAFNHYRCNRDFSMGLNLADMAPALRCANNDDITTIKVKDDSCDFVSFTFESPDGKISYYEFDFVDIERVPFVIPESLESKYQAIVRLPSAKFMRICKKLSSFGDSKNRDTVISITVDEERVLFFSQGKTWCSIVFLTVDKAEVPTLIEMKEQVSMTFDLRCVNSFSKASTLSDQVTISISSTLPALFEYKIGEMGYIRYYLAPRVSMQNEGDEMQTIAKEDKMQNEGDEMQKS